MRSVSIRSTTPGRKAEASQQQPNGLPAQTPQARPVSPCEDLHVLIATRAYEFYSERGYRDGSALDDWLDAEGGGSQSNPAGPTGRPHILLVSNRLTAQSWLCRVRPTTKQEVGSMAPATKE
jgi:hypothetical protein